MGKIEIIIKGTPQDRAMTLTALLEQASDNEIRELLCQLDNARLKRMAQLVHGRIYGRM